MSKEIKECLEIIKKTVRKDYGKKCKDFHPYCVCCLVWLAYESLEVFLTDTIND